MSAFYGHLNRLDTAEESIGEFDNRSIENSKLKSKKKKKKIRGKKSNIEH